MIEHVRSIRSKIRRAILLTSTLVLMLTFISYLVYEFVSYRAGTARQLSTLAEIIALNSTAALAFDSQKDAEEILSALRAEKTIVSACLYNEQGKLFANYPRELQSKDFPEVPGNAGYTFSQNHLEGFQPVAQGEKKLGTLYIKKSIMGMYERFMLYGFIAIGVMTICLGVAYLLSKKLQSGIANPIISLAVTARAVSQNHDYSVRAVKDTDDETGLLTDAFNHMLAQIEHQSKEIQSSREELQQYAVGLEAKVEQRTAEYKRQRDFNEAVLEASLDIIGVYDKEVRLLAINKNFLEKYGRTREELIGQKLLDIYPHAVDLYNNIVRSLNGDAILNEKYHSPIVDRYYERSYVPLRTEANEVYAVLVTAHDVTESLMAQRSIEDSASALSKTNEILTRKNQELEQFAYVASHDLQEPLRKIQTFMDLMRKNTHAPATLERYMQKIEASAARMSALIRDVLDYSRLSQTNLPIDSVNLQNVLENVLTDLELIIEEKRAIITSDPLPTVQGFKLQLHQLFSNLINNSLKFCEQTPVIKVSAEQALPGVVAEHGLDVAKQYLKLTFSDNGIGFEQKFADKIFTIFQRLNTDTRFQGTGIGLALCKKIVENHQGSIRVVSAAGQGASFTILIPYQHQRIDEINISTVNVIQ